MTDTLSGLGASARYMMLYSGIHFKVFGLAKARPSSISCTKLAGSLTNFFMGDLIDWVVRIQLGAIRLRWDRSKSVHECLHNGRDRYDAGIQRPRTSIARERLPAAPGNPWTCRFDRGRRLFRGFAQCCE